MRPCLFFIYFQILMAPSGVIAGVKYKKVEDMETAIHTAVHDTIIYHERIQYLDRYYATQISSTPTAQYE